MMFACCIEMITLLMKIRALIKKAKLRKIPLKLKLLLMQKSLNTETNRALKLFELHFVINAHHVH